MTRLSFFLTWWGAFLLAALDSTILPFLPFGIDALVIYLPATKRDHILDLRAAGNGGVHDRCSGDLLGRTEGR